MSNAKSSKKTEKETQKKFYEKLELSKAGKIWYIFVPLAFAIIALVFSILDIETQVINREPSKVKETKYYLGITEVFHSDRYINEVSMEDVLNNNTSSKEETTTGTSGDGFIGDPNVIGIVACVTMILCIMFIPKSMLKIREHGDGLGLMFLPLGLLCINNVLCILIFNKDLLVGIGFSVICFIISGLATFKNYIKYIYKACIVMLLVAIFLILASLSPYCYNETISYSNYENVLYTSPVRQYYISYFFRDLFLIGSFGIFSSFVAKTYAFNTEKK